LAAGAGGAAMSETSAHITKTTVDPIGLIKMLSEWIINLLILVNCKHFSMTVKGYTVIIREDEAVVR
jgi:hypothetical protein